MQKQEKLWPASLHAHASSEYTEDLLENALASAGLSPVDRGLCQEIVYGVVRWQAVLDWLIAQIRPCASPACRIAPPRPVSNLLARPHPHHAAVNETSSWPSEMAAAHWLRQRRPARISARVDATEMLAELRRRTRPRLLASRMAGARWQKRWGDDRTRQLLAWNNTAENFRASIH